VDEWWYKKGAVLVDLPAVDPPQTRGHAKRNTEKTVVNKMRGRRHTTRVSNLWRTAAYQIYADCYYYYYYYYYFYYV